MKEKYSHLTININDDGLMQDGAYYLQPDVAYSRLPDLKKYSKLLWHDGCGNKQLLNLHNLRALPVVAIFHYIITQDPSFILRYKGNNLAKFMVQFLAVKDFDAIEVCLGRKLTSKDERAIIEAEKIFIIALDNYSAAALEGAVDALNTLAHLGAELQDGLMSLALRKSNLISGVKELDAWQVKNIIDVFDSALEVEPKFAIIKKFFLQKALTHLASSMPFEDIIEVLSGDKPILELLNPASITLLKHAPIKFSVEMLRRLQVEGMQPTAIERLFTVLITNNLADNKKALEVLAAMPLEVSITTELDLLQIAAFAYRRDMPDVCLKIITQLAGSKNADISSFCSVVGQLFGQDNCKHVIDRLFDTVKHLNGSYDANNAIDIAAAISPAELMTVYINRNKLQYAYAIMETMPKEYLALNIAQALLPLYSKHLELVVYVQNEPFRDTKRFESQKRLIKLSKCFVVKMLERLNGELGSEQIKLLTKYVFDFYKLFDDVKFVKLILNHCYDSGVVDLEDNYLQNLAVQAKVKSDKVLLSFLAKLEPKLGVYFQKPILGAPDQDSPFAGIIKVDELDMGLQIVGAVSSDEVVNMAEA